MTQTSSNIIWADRDAASAVQGTLQGGPWTATGISIDTRSLQAGDLFIALRGDQGDGHDYVAQALEKGAAAAVVERIPDGLSGANLLLVKDTLEAMRNLGRAARARTGAKVIAITGSVGKTGTKEMLAAAFGALGQVHASSKSYNNHWGVPYSLASMHGGVDYGIFEIGMNHTGEISPLSQMVRPDVAIITTVAPVHLEHFASERDIADAKAEIFDGMKPGAIAILNRDNEWFSHLKGHALEKNMKVLSFGEHENADCRMIDCIEAANGSRVQADIMGEQITFTLQIPGRHIAQNALAVLLAVHVMHGDVRAAAASLSRIQPIAGRGMREYLDIGDAHNPVTLIDESYNASPTSMRASFKVLALVDPGRGGRRIAILGDMRELGAQGARLHAELALPLRAADVQLVYTCGPLMKNLYDALPEGKKGAHKDNSHDLAQIVPDVLTPGDVVMVKGSNGSKMGVVVEAMRSMAAARATKKEDLHAL